jgi:signal peptidase I
MKIGKLFGLIFNLLFVLIILAAAVIILAPYAGWRMDTVLSGSMEPSIHVGSLIIVQPVDASQVKAGDIIAFSRGTSKFATGSSRLVKDRPGRSRLKETPTMGRTWNR